MVTPLILDCITILKSFIGGEINGKRIKPKMVDMRLGRHLRKNTEQNKIQEIKAKPEGCFPEQLCQRLHRVKDVEDRESHNMWQNGRPQS